MPGETLHTASVLVELGAVFAGLALLLRTARRHRFSGIPLFLLAGLALGEGGVLPLDFTRDFISTGGEIGVLLLLFMLGLEYSGAELGEQLRTGLRAGAVDLLLNFTPGVLAGLIAGWTPMAAVLLGGVTWISSSGVIARLMSDSGSTDSPEGRTVISVLVLEDLAMAVWLPVVSVLLVGGGLGRMAMSASVAVFVVALAVLTAIHFGSALSRFVSHESDEVIVLTMFGAVMLVGGVAQRAGVSSAVGAFLVGIAASGPLAAQAHRLLAPLRDLFAAAFFFFFGLQTAPSSLLPVLPFAVTLAVVTALTKVGTGYWAARDSGLSGKARVRAGVTLIPRGEFSIVIAGLGAAIEPSLAPLAAAYVLLLAIAGPVLIRLVR